MDISGMEPIVAAPSLPSNAYKVSALSHIKVDQVFLGSCTNGRIEDMRMAAAILKGRTIHPDVRMIVLPGTQLIMKQMIAEGLVDIFIDAGAVVGPPTCGPCAGVHMGMLGDNEVCLSTTNRNFVGRMGSPKAQIYLANPAIAAGTAVQGYICHPGLL
jgi:3-isopropylmalate/(R)-2-methylmalate dehydratase large subunit